MVAERKRIQPETDGTRVTTLLEHDGLAAHTAFSPEGRTRSEGTRYSQTPLWPEQSRPMLVTRDVVVRALKSSAAYSYIYKHNILDLVFANVK